MSLSRIDRRVRIAHSPDARSVLAACFSASAPRASAIPLPGLQRDRELEAIAAVDRLARMRSRTKLIVTLLALGLGGVTVEAALRIAHVGPIPQPLETGALLQTSADARLRFENVPGASSCTQFLDRRGEVVREVVTHVNAAGLRGEMVAPKKPDGTLRIACLGDSQTFGHRVADDESWPAALQSALRARFPARRIEVLNFGVGGYDAEQEVALLEDRALDYEPDIVVLGFFVNDTEVSEAVPEAPPTILPKLVRFFSRDSSGPLHWMRAHSRIVDLACDWEFHRLTRRLWTERSAALYAEQFAGWTRARAAILRAREIVEARGGRFAVLLVPLLLASDDTLLSSRAYRTVSAFCAAHAIAYYDPEPLFAGLDLDELRIHPRDMHTNGQGNRIIGGGLADWLTEHGRLEPRR
jgi:lysophospholipase L1-like esterase